LDYEKQNEEIGLIASSIKIKPDNIAAFTDSEDQNAKYESILNDFVQNIRIMSVENKKDFNLPVLAYYGTDFIDTKIYIKEDELLHVEFFDTYVGSLETEKFNFKQFFLALDKQQKIKLQDSKKKNNFLIAIEKAISSILSDGQTKYTNLRIEWGEKYDEMLMDKISNEIKETLFINQMSSGEKTLIALVADIVRRLYLANSKNINPLEGHGIVLIDEIELHLHPKWQRKVLPKLLETFPNIQFVITTHSPLVLDTLKPNNIRLLLNNEFIIPDFYPKGREIGEILEELMGENAVSIQAQVDEYFKLIAQNKILEANTFKQEVLLKLTDSENPIFYHANAMLKLKST
jgi:predicted ATP-binding protein involved in virulence